MAYRRTSNRRRAPVRTRRSPARSRSRVGRRVTSSRGRSYSSRGRSGNTLRIVIEQPGAGPAVAAPVGQRPADPPKSSQF